MGIRRVTSSGGSAFGSESLSRWQEWITWPGFNAAARDSNFTGFAFARHMPIAFNAGNPAQLWVNLGNQVAQFRVISDVQVIDVFAIAGAIGAQECVHTWRGGLITNGWGVEFYQTFPPALESSPGVESSLAVVIAGWMRKRLAGDATSAAQFVGLINNNGDINRSTRVARIGIMGDGGSGFRFGSVNCPDAPPGGADNGATDIDGGSFQPAVLVNPGANWFHVKIKLVPATPTQSGRWGAYLNGRLVATFTNANNLPHTSRSAIDVSGAEYWPIQPAICAFGNGGAAPSPGYYLRDLRVRLEQDTSL